MADYSNLVDYLCHQCGEVFLLKKVQDDCAKCNQKKGKSDTEKVAIDVRPTPIDYGVFTQWSMFVLGLATMPLVRPVHLQHETSTVRTLHVPLAQCVIVRFLCSRRADVLYSPGFASGISHTA